MGQVPGIGQRQPGGRGHRLLKEQHRAQGALRENTDAEAVFLKVGPGTGV